MRIIYLLKKGLQCFPPCLMHILYLNDLGVDLCIYHGKNTPAIDKILDGRKIEHHSFKCDKDNRTKYESALNYLAFKNEIRDLANKLSNDSILWFGNAETLVAFPRKKLKKFRFVATVLELYNQGSFLDKGLAKVINHAELVICCEKHRSAIMMSRYSLNKMPFVIPNKPYDLHEEVSGSKQHLEMIKKYIHRTIIVYQGIITPDRPLDKIASALKRIGEDNIFFFVLGKYTNEIKEKITSIYPNTVFWGYIPAPEHLAITKHCSIGVANYDMSCLNNVFCAPNKIYEYTKYGLPLIASQNIGLSETVGEYGAAECVDFTDINQIELGVRKILSDFSRYTEKANEFYFNTDNEAVLRLIVHDLGKH